MSELRDAEAFIEQFTSLKPELGLVLGSGLAELADLVTDPVLIDTAHIPGYPVSTVQGHTGRLVIGKIGDVAVIFVQGRLHVYEGHSVQSSTFPIRLLARLGVERIVVTNAAGGINAGFKPGTLMWITDHINWTPLNPLIGASSATVQQAQQARNAFSPSPYDTEWTMRAADLARQLGVETTTGTYLWTLGPSYETKAEIRAFKTLGADAVGMSTVPEVIQARALGMRVLGLSTITNFAAGLSQDELNHEEVLEVGKQVRSDLERLILAIIGD
jgi:purine-nucleoside phosphorylase